MNELYDRFRQVDLENIPITYDSCDLTFSCTVLEGVDVLLQARGFATMYQSPIGRASSY